MQIFVNRNGPGLIEEQEIEPGEYIPNTLVTSEKHKANVVIVNTTGKAITKPNTIFKLEEFNIVNINLTKKCTQSPRN